MAHIDVANLAAIFNYEFMRHAFMAGSLAAILAAITGYFMALRHLTFAGHALSHIGFAGAAGAGLIGLAPLTGQLLITIGAAFGMGASGARLARNDFIIGIILAFALGLGVLFLHFYHSYAGSATAILFGDILGVSTAALQTITLLTLVCLAAISLISRPLLFASIEGELAAAKGVSLPLLNSTFLMIMAIAVTLASQVVGVLLVFALLVGPAAIALQWTRSFWKGISLSLVLALSTVWLGIILAYLTDWPVSFWICSLIFGVYLAGLFKNTAAF